MPTYQVALVLENGKTASLGVPYLADSNLFLNERGSVIVKCAWTVTEINGEALNLFDKTNHVCLYYSTAQVS